jgi:hypothetical protein
MGAADVVRARRRVRDERHRIVRPAANQEPGGRAAPGRGLDACPVKVRLGPPDAIRTMLDCDRDIAMADMRQRAPAGSPIAVDALLRCVAGSDAGPSDEAAHAIAA